MEGGNWMGEGLMRVPSWVCVGKGKWLDGCENEWKSVTDRDGDIGGISRKRW